MTATCEQIITYALRQAKVIGVGKTPKTAELTEGLVALQSLYDGWRTGGMFGELEDVSLDQDETALEGKRYFVPTGYTLTDATSVYEDEDYETRQPRDLALYEALTQAGAHSARLYDRTAWVDLIGLTLASTAPLSGRGAYGLAAVLATSAGFATVFGAEPDQRTYQLAGQFLRGLMNTATTQDKFAPDYF